MRSKRDALVYIEKYPVRSQEKISVGSISLEQFGINGYGWEKEDAITLLNTIMKDKIGILGGDVYKLVDNFLEPLSDSWFTEPTNLESETEYYLRSKRDSLAYIEKYPVLAKEKILFSLIFTEKFC